MQHNSKFTPKNGDKTPLSATLSHCDFFKKNSKSLENIIFFLKSLWKKGILAHGTIWGVVVAPQILDFFFEKIPQISPTFKTKKTHSGLFLGIRGLYSPKLKAVPHPTHKCALWAIRFQSPDDKEIHTTDRIAEVPHKDYTTTSLFRLLYSMVYLTTSNQWLPYFVRVPPKR